MLLKEDTLFLFICGLKRLQRVSIDCVPDSPLSTPCLYNVAGSRLFPLKSIVVNQGNNGLKYTAAEE